MLDGRLFCTMWNTGLGKHRPGKVLMIPADEALERLRQGNHRYADEPSLASWVLEAFEPHHLLEGQQPFAAVVGCADSRVPVTISFQQGPGALFVVRVAGNIIGSSVLGSLEYAVDVLQTKLILILGHTRCGAVTAAVQQAAAGKHPPSQNLRSITDRILAGIEPAFDDITTIDVDQAIEENVRASMRALVHQSPLLADHVGRDVKIIGGIYDLRNGRVRFLE